MVMSQIAMELDQKATELGFQSLQEALDAGCVVEYGSDGNSELVEPLVAAHRAWEKEKEEVRVGLAMVADNLPAGSEVQQAVERAIKFVESCHE